MGSPWYDNQSHYLPTEHYPWIVFPCDSHHRNQIFCSLSYPHKIFQKSIPELNDTARVVARCNDWLLLIKGGTNFQYSLWNPTIPKSIKLPPISLKPNSKVDCWALSSPKGVCDPKSYKVLLFDKSNRSIIFIRPEVEFMRWIELPYGQLLRDIGVVADNEEEEEDYLQQCVSCNGKLYAMSYHSSRVVIIDVDRDDQLIMKSLPCVHPNLGSYGIHYCEFLADLGDELYLIRIFYDGALLNINEVIDVVIFKLDFSSMVWNNARDLSGGTFFFDGYHVSSATTLGNEIARDSIYFTMPQDMGWFYCFNMKDCSLQVNLPCPVSTTSYFRPMFFMAPSNARLINNNAQMENNMCRGKQLAKCIVKVHEKEDSTTETEVPATKFDDLPLLAMKLISDSLDLFDYNMNFRTLSRVCRSEAPKLGRKRALEKLEGSPLCPWLLFPTNMTTHNFLDPKHAYRFLMTFPESLVKSQVRCMKHSWMMMSDYENSVSFYNPFTKATIDINIPSQHPIKFSNSHVMGFSTMPNSSRCLLVGFSGISQQGILVSVAVLRHRELEWDIFGLECQFNMTQGSPVFFDEVFYVLGQEGNLLAFQCEVEGNAVVDIHWNIIDSKILCGSYQKSYILEWDKQLAIVFVGPMGTWIRVFKFNTTTLTQQSVENLGDDAFFVSQSSCLAMEARSLGMHNRIYFPRIRGNSIMYYSLETRKFHYDNEDYLHDFHNTKEQLRSGWFDPRFF